MHVVCAEPLGGFLFGKVCNGAYKLFVSLLLRLGSVSVACGLQITHETHLSVDLHMQSMLDEAYDMVKALLERNRAALDALIEGLIQTPGQQLDGTEVRDIIEQNGDSNDLQHRSENQTVFA